MKIDWATSESHVFANPRLPESAQKLMPQHWREFNSWRSHLWVATSGTTRSSADDSGLNWVALSKNAFLKSAAAVNRHLDAASHDIWLNILPLFHVGSIAIFARAHLTQSKVIDHSQKKWDACTFYTELEESHATLTALVPTQVFDLVQARIKPSGHLRAAIVGGGRLQSALYAEAVKLGWPLIPSYGMTETASQIATARLGSPELIPLDHMELKTDRAGLLSIKSEALLTGTLKATPTEFIWKDPKDSGWLHTEDFVKLEGGALTFIGRMNDVVKISGENVSLAILEELFLNLSQTQDAALLAIPDDRLGHKIVLVATHALKDPALFVTEFNSKVMPYERIRETVLHNHLPRTALGKVQKGQLIAQLTTAV